MTTQKTIIGYAVATNAFEYHPSKEFAGACETIEVPAGRYPIEMSRYYGTPYYSIALEGVSTYRGWFGSNVRVDTTPELASPHESIRCYELAYAVLEGKARGALRFELAEGYEARRIPFVGTDGEAHETAGIFHNGENIK